MPKPTKGPRLGDGQQTFAGAPLSLKRVPDERDRD